MARLSVDTLGISEVKWTGTCKFNSDDHYFYYPGQESLRRNGVALIFKSPKRRIWVQSQNDGMISVLFQGKPFNNTAIQVYAPTTYSKEAEVEWFYDDLQELLELR